MTPPTSPYPLFLPLSPHANIVWQLLPAAANNNGNWIVWSAPNAKRVNIMFYFYFNLFHLLLVTFADFFRPKLAAFKRFFQQLVGAAATAAAAVAVADLK